MLRRLGLVFYLLAVILVVFDLIDMGRVVSDTWFGAGILILLGFVFAGNPVREAE